MFQITHLAGSRVPDRLVGPILAISDGGQQIVAADALLMGDCAAVRFLRTSPQSPPEVLGATLAVVAVLALINCHGIPFVPGGREFRDERRAAEPLGFHEQTAISFMRFELFGYDPAPAGALILDPTEPIPLANIVLGLIGHGIVDVPVLNGRWVPSYLATLAREGVPLQDRPPGSRWLH
jgi:hypothetical protein